MYSFCLEINIRAAIHSDNKIILEFNKSIKNMFEVEVIKNVGAKNSIGIIINIIVVEVVIQHLFIHSNIGNDMSGKIIFNIRSHLW